MSRPAVTRLAILEDAVTRLARRGAHGDAGAALLGLRALGILSRARTALQSSNVCGSCRKVIPYKAIVPLCDACDAKDCPSHCESPGTMEVIGRWPNGCPRYRCNDCGTEWSNTEETGEPPRQPCPDCLNGRNGPGRICLTCHGAAFLRPSRGQ